MAHADSFPDDALDTVAAELGREPWLSASEAMRNAGRVYIAETFAVWTIGADAVTRGETPFADLARHTGRWHHQIKYAGEARAYARSTPLGPHASDWSLLSVFESDIARKIDEAIDWVDQNVRGDPLVRLLTCPAFYVHAFWLTGQGYDEVLVVDMPREFAHLQPLTLYAPKDFLENLAMEEKKK